jgi:putative flippase GtrA
MKVARYLMVGGASAAVDFSIYAGLTLGLSIHYLVAGALGFMIALCVNYFLSVRFVFTSGIRFNKKQEFIAVFGVSAIGLLMHQVALFVCVDSLEFGLMIAKIFATASTFAWNYTARARFVFATAKPM